MGGRAERVPRRARRGSVKPFSARELIARVRVNLELARVRAEAGRLAALEDVRTHVIATASHELRTPVSAIYGAARTLTDRDRLSDETRTQLLAVIRSESERLAQITDQILTTESLAHGRIVPATERVDLREAILEAVAAARARTPEPERLQTSLPDRPTTAEVDPTRLQQVLSNLLDNAIKYGDDGAGPVLVQLEEGDAHATITVADHGIGVPPDARERIFDRFYRFDPEQKRGVGGAGLGLHISRELVQVMGGSISVEPNEPDGSRFVISFPTRRD